MCLCYRKMSHTAEYGMWIWNISFGCMAWGFRVEHQMCSESAGGFGGTKRSPAGQYNIESFCLHRTNPTGYNSVAGQRPGGPSRSTLRASFSFPPPPLATFMDP